MSRLHLGLILPNYGPALEAERLARVTAAAEEARFDSAWVTDHLIVPVEHAEIYGTIAEALVTLGFLAGRTQRIALGVSALVVPQRNPLVALKQLTSLDFLSGGRIVTAVAAGWMEGEFRTLCAPFERRGRLLNEWLELAHAVFALMPGHVRYEGSELSVDGWLAPGLVRRGGPELWVAGVSRATLRRAGLTGVWHPVGLPPGSCGGWLRSCVNTDRMRESCFESASSSPRRPVRAPMSAAVMRSQARPSGSPSASRSTSTLVATASSSTSVTRDRTSTSACGRSPPT